MKRIFILGFFIIILTAWTHGRVQVNLTNNAGVNLTNDASIQLTSGN